MGLVEAAPTATAANLASALTRHGMRWCREMVRYLRRLDDDKNGGTFIKSDYDEDGGA